MDRIKGFVGLTVLTPIAGAAISGIGNVAGSMGAGIASATQSLAGTGFALGAAKMTGVSDFFKK